MNLAYGLAKGNTLEPKVIIETNILITCAL